jgi:hypothetical protein
LSYFPTHALKARDPQGFGGSNPSASAGQTRRSTIIGLVVGRFDHNW